MCSIEKSTFPRPYAKENWTVFFSFFFISVAFWVTKWWLSLTIRIEWFKNWLTAQRKRFYWLFPLEFWMTPFIDWLLTDHFDEMTLIGVIWATGFWVLSLNQFIKLFFNVLMAFYCFEYSWGWAISIFQSVK